MIPLTKAAITPQNHLWVESQATFGKRENEKKRQKKRLEKAEKKEERQASAQKGQSLDEMLAYVDENGNIVDTPPDPKKKKEINVADIRIGAIRQEDMEPEDPIRKGTVTFFNDSKGYGFIKDKPYPAERIRARQRPDQPNQGKRQSSV